MAVDSILSSPLGPPACEKDAKALQFIEEMTRNADIVQEKVLAEILSRNARTEYLQRFKLHGATNRDIFKSEIPMVTYEDLQPDIQRIANGDRSPILSSHPISEFLTSSGTSAGERKLMPTIKEELDRRQQLYSLLTPVMNLYVPGLDKGKGLYFLFVKSATKTPGGLLARPVLTSYYNSDHFKTRPYDPYNVMTSPNEAILCVDSFQSMYSQMLCGLYERQSVLRLGAVFASGLLRAIRFLHAGGGHSNLSGEPTYQRYGIQQIARWVDQILPFSLLLLVVFIRQHLQGFFGAIWISAVLFKSNEILRKQTALKGERKISVLVCITVIFMLHVGCVYWWYQDADLIYPLVLLPPKEVPPFWHAIFVIMVNDTMVRQAAMVFKCILLMYYKNTGGHNYRRQGQMLTLVEYILLLYRALLPTPVWYRFFLNKEYGSLFSSLTTGLYLTFKLTSIVQKVQLFFSALRALSCKEIHYGAYATSEQINAAGDLCAICQEKMQAPIFLSCKHIFCEECVAEWFERERTCPLCRALVRPADIKSYGDGSTSLFFQIF